VRHGITLHTVGEIRVPKSQHDVCTAAPHVSRRAPPPEPLEINKSQLKKREKQKCGAPRGSERSPDSEAVRAMLQTSSLRFDVGPQKFEFVMLLIMFALGASFFKNLAFLKRRPLESTCR
jgi:hypothetical protein